MAAFALMPPAFAQSESLGAFNPLYQLATLDPVVVTANRFEEEYRLVPAHVTYISRREILENNIQTVNEAITRLGGFVGRSSLGGGREQTIDIGGFGDTTQSNTVILIDGVPLSEADSTEVRISGIPIETVQAIEIHRSSASVLYGGGAVGGVIHIMTSLAIADHNRESGDSLSVGGGSYGSKEYRLNARHYGQNLALFFSANALSSDGYRKNSAIKESGGLFSLRYSTSSTLFGFSASSESQKFRTPGPLSASEFIDDPRAAQPESLANKTYNDIRQQRLTAFLEAESPFAIFKLDGSIRSRASDALAVQFGSPVALTFKGDSKYGALTARKPVEFDSLRNQFLLGYEMLIWDQDRRYSRAGPFGARDTLESKSKSIFFKNDLDIKPTSTRLSVGYRVEKNERQVRYENSTVYPRDFRQRAFEFGISQAISPGVVAFARSAKSYRFANIDEFSTATALPPTFDPIPIAPQTSRDLEFGLRYAAASGGRAQARIYQSRLNDEIIYDVFQYANINLDQTRRRGIDLDVSWPVSKSVRVSGALALREAEFTQGPHAGKDIPMSSPRVVMFAASWVPTEQHRFGLDAQWVGSQNPAGDYENSYRVPSYWIANMQYQYRIGRVEISAAVRNLFDRSYYSYATLVPRYDMETFTSVFDYLGVYPDSGRSLWASFRYSF